MLNDSLVYIARRYTISAPLCDGAIILYNYSTKQLGNRKISVIARVRTLADNIHYSHTAIAVGPGCPIQNSTTHAKLTTVNMQRRQNYYFFFFFFFMQNVIRFLFNSTEIKQRDSVHRTRKHTSQKSHALLDAASRYNRGMGGRLKGKTIIYYFFSFSYGSAINVSVSKF